MAKNINGLSTVKNTRLIWILADSRRRYAMNPHFGEPETYSDWEIETLVKPQWGNQTKAFSPDLQTFYPNVGSDQIGSVIVVTAFELEPLSEPVKPEYLPE